MAIYYVASTDTGKELAKQFAEDGKNADINLFEATILAIASEGITFTDLVNEIDSSYPHSMRADSIGEKVRILERRGLISLVDAVNHGTAVIISFHATAWPEPRVIASRQNLGVFFMLNKFTEEQSAKVLYDLQWDGEHSFVRYGLNIKVEIAP